MTGDWVFGAIAVLTLLHGVVLLYAYRRGQPADFNGGADAETCANDADVECPSCGELNERGYQFCRRCVSELPAPMSYMNESSALASRRTL